MKKLSLVLFASFILSFTSDKNKSTYQIPISAFSVTAGDIDLDGDNDIIVGHRTPWLDENPVVTILNNNNGDFTFADTIKDFYGYQENILLTDVNNNGYKDIIAFKVDFSTNTAERDIRVIYNNQGVYDSFKNFSLNKTDPFTDIEIGDINDDSFIDLALISNNGQFWGIIYNDGYGNFSNPQYFETIDAHPNSIKCGDINGDGRADIVLCQQSVEVFFSTEDGFENIQLEGNLSGKFDSEIVDFDLDGDLDVLTYGSWHYAYVNYHENIGDMQFKNPIEFIFDTENASARFSITDFDNNQHPDLIFEISDFNGYWIYYNNGGFQFTDSLFVNIPPANPKERSRNFQCADMDGNGYQDIICVKTVDKIAPDNLEIKYNNGEGDFVDNPISNVNDINILNSSISAYPNPFQKKTTIQFELNTSSLITISITNINGQIVYQQHRKYTVGKQQFIWDGKNTKGYRCNPGTYIANISIDNKTQNQIKIIIN
jgi:hypothetical protein